MIGFLASQTGRIIRIVAGAILVLLGLFVIKDTVGIIVAVIGLVPLLAGALDYCVFAPLFGQPFSGKGIRGEK